MKKSFLGFVFVLLAHWAVGQSNTSINNYINLVGNSTSPVSFSTNDSRVFMQLENKASDGNSVVSINLKSGLNSGTTALQHLAREFSWPFTPSPFAGYGQVYSRDRGLILRTGSPENLNGVIKFMTGSSNSYGFAERMRIAATGEVGIGTENPKSKLQVTDGDVYIDNPNRGIIMKDVNGGCWRITLGVVGNFVSTPIVCP
jgi:hypothetical protein